MTPAASEPLVSHVPLLHVADCEPHGTLLGHFARANPHADTATGVESIAIFHGPHAYVSPSWYAEPAAAVPTWNYAVVHAHGTLELAREPAETRAILDAADPPLRVRPRRAVAAGTRPRRGWRRWSTRSSASASGSSGIDAKFKLSQNRSPDDRARVAAALDGRRLCRSRRPPRRGCARTSREPMASADAGARARRRDPLRQVAVGGAVLQDAEPRGARNRRRPGAARRRARQAGARRARRMPWSRFVAAALPSKSSITACSDRRGSATGCGEALPRDRGEHCGARARGASPAWSRSRCSTRFPGRPTKRDRGSSRIS